VFHKGIVKQYGPLPSSQVKEAFRGIYKANPILNLRAQLVTTNKNFIFVVLSLQQAISDIC